MRYLTTVIEQIDRAVTELITDHPINNRLALILTDNATELVLHRRCMDRLYWDAILKELSAQQKAAARGVFLEEKLKFLKALGDLTEAEEQFIKIAHSYRNELYHVGLTHDNIIRPIVGQYFRVSCDLFGRLKPSWRSSGPRFTVSEVASKYIGRDTGKPASLNFDLSEVASNLRNACPNGIPPVNTALSKFALASIDEIEEAFQFLVRNNPERSDKGEVLREIQWNLDVIQTMQKEGIDGAWHDAGYRINARRIRTEFEAGWRQRHTSLPLQRWRNRANAIAKEPDISSLSRYQALRTDMAYIKQAIIEAASELDAWLQNKADYNRGK